MGDSSCISESPVNTEGLRIRILQLLESSDENISARSIRNSLENELSRPLDDQTDLIRQTIDQYVSQLVVGSESDSSSSDSENEDEFINNSHDEEEELPKPLDRGKKRSRPLTKKRLKKAARIGPKKPLTAWIFFQSQKRQSVRLLHPEMSFAEISREISRMWKALPDTEKEIYTDLARKDKGRYDNELQAFETRTKEAALSDSDSESPLAMDEEIAVVEKLETTFDKAVKTGKLGRKTFTFDEETIDNMVLNLLEEMQNAFSQDLSLFSQSLPATNKLSMLKNVSSLANKKQFTKRLLDEGLLRRIGEWLTPLPDGSLPNASLRQQLYGILNKLPVDIDYLYDSEDESGNGIGKVLIQLWRQETGVLRSELALVIESWIRIVSGVSTNYTDLSQISDFSRNEFIDRKSHATSRVGGMTMHAEIPSKAIFDYQVQPQSLLEDETHSRRSESGFRSRIQRKLVKKR